jgi:hypothetical protein
MLRDPPPVVNLRIYASRQPFLPRFISCFRLRAHFGQKREDEFCCFQNTNTHWGQYGRPVWNQEAGATEGCEPNLGSATLAALAAPYRHPRLNAMKLAGNPTNPLRIRDDATAGELRAEILKAPQGAG